MAPALAHLHPQTQPLPTGSGQGALSRGATCGAPTPHPARPPNREAGQAFKPDEPPGNLRKLLSPARLWGEPRASGTVCLARSCLISKQRMCQFHYDFLVHKCTAQMTDYPAVPNAFAVPLQEQKRSWAVVVGEGWRTSCTRIIRTGSQWSMPWR